MTSPSTADHASGIKIRAARLGHVGIAVRDLDHTVEFYTRHIGLRLTERFAYGADQIGHGVDIAAGAFVRADTTHHCISFFTFRDDLGSEPSPHPYGLHHLAFEMRTPAHLVALYREFKTAGIEIVNARIGGPGNQPRFYARDPDGNLLEFYWGIDEIGWSGQARTYPSIQEIDLENFDFAAFERARELDAERVSEH